MLFSSKGKFINLALTTTILRNRLADQSGEVGNWVASFADGSYIEFEASVLAIEDALATIVPAPAGYSLLHVDNNDTFEEPVLALGFHSQNEGFATVYTALGKSDVLDHMGLVEPSGRVVTIFQIFGSRDEFIKHVRTKAAAA